MTLAAKVLLVANSILVCATGVTLADAAVVTECGTTVTNEAVWLEADLDCTGLAHDGDEYFFALELVNARLELRGFSILTTDASLGTPYHGVLCTGDCWIKGQGAISGFVKGVSAHRSARVSDVTIGPNRQFGVEGLQGTSVVRLRNSEVIGNGDDGILASFVWVTNSVIGNNGWGGVAGLRGLRIRDSIIQGNGHDHPYYVEPFAVYGGGDVALVANSVIRDNYAGVYNSAERSVLVVKESLVEGNETTGIWSDGPAVLLDAYVDNNGGDGVVSTGGFVTLRGASVVRSNGAACPAGGLCADVVAARRPTRARGAECGSSLRLDRTATWNICEND